MSRRIPTLITAGALALTLTACSGSDDTTMETAAPATEAAQQDSPAADAAPRPWDRHEMCEPDDGTANMLTGALNDPSLTIDNAQLIRDGGDTWIGASLVRPDGDFESRSDVWLLRDGALYSVSNGAQNNGWGVSAPGVDMSNEYAAGVDRCVVAETMGR